MSRTILLDSGLLGLITNPKASPQTAACGRWVVDALDRGSAVFVPEIADYEVRGELIWARRRAGIERLDAFIAQIEYLPIETAAMRQAAVFWAEARQEGRPTAPDAALDADVILAAQAVTLNRPNTIVATTNPKHLSRYIPAALWTDII
ncbi:MAG: nuclease [bacterium]|nr:nuclease [bacterium]